MAWPSEKHTHHNSFGGRNGNPGVFKDSVMILMNLKIVMFMILFMSSFMKNEFSYQQVPDYFS